MKRIPNILIVTFDCLRPDHLNAVGYKGSHTPTFDRVIDEGVLFTNAYCQAPNTWISHASLFTGCNPYRHGLRTPLRRISDDIRTLAEIYQAAGFATFGLPAMSLLSEEAGFARGFEEYRLDGLQGESGSRVVPHRYYRSALDTLDITCQWLTRTARPFYGWIHYFGTHKVEESLLDLPGEYRKQYSEYAQYYDGKIAFADEQFLAPLVRHLQNLGVLDETILVLWSDHGEDLRLVEHDSPQWGHNFALTESVMRTLLAIRAPGCLPGGQQRQDIAQSIDVFPTLLEMTGIQPPAAQSEGGSLVRPSSDGDPVIYMENLCQGFVGLRKGRFKLTIRQTREPLQRRRPGHVALRDKLLRHVARIGDAAQPLLAGPQKLGALLGRASKQDKRLRPWWGARGEPEEVVEALLDHGVCELYDLFSDPHERDNIATEHVELVVQLKEQIRMRSAEARAQQMAYSVEDEAEVAKRLRGLGYLQQ